MTDRLSQGTILSTKSSMIRQNRSCQQCRNTTIMRLTVAKKLHLSKDLHTSLVNLEIANQDHLIIRQQSKTKSYINQTKRRHTRILKLHRRHYIPQVILMTVKIMQGTLYSYITS